MKQARRSHICIKTKFTKLSIGDKFVVLNIGEKFDEFRHRVFTKSDDDHYTETDASGEIRRYNSVNALFIDVHQLLT